MRRLLCIGECMVEMSPTKDGTYAMGFAGDTFNTAWYARRLAVPDTEVAYLTAVGDDDPSRRMVEFMRASGVNPKVKVRRDGQVGLYMINLKNGDRSFAYWRNAAAARTLADDLDTLPDVRAGDMVLFSGITVAILPEDGRRRLFDVLSSARATGVTIAFDPNLRPRLWASASDMCDWITTASKTADIVLPSFEDEAAFFGDADIRATAARYRAAGAQLVVTKNGGDPVLVSSDAGDTLVDPEPVSVLVDTTAAGDSFNAAFLVALSVDGDPTRAASSACKVSAQVVTKRGALVELDRDLTGL